MYKQIGIILLAGTLSISTFTNIVLAKEEAEYQVQKEEGMQTIFEDLYTKKVGDFELKKTVNVNKEKILYYKSKNYTIKCQSLDFDKEGKQNVTITLSKKGKASILEKDETSIEVINPGIPSIEVLQNTIETQVNQEVDLNNYVHASDGKGNALQVSFEGDVNYGQVGKYIVKVSATDSYNQCVSTELTIDVKEDDDFYQNIANSALSQIGVNQDCTMLATNALASVGIYFHGWPEDYLSLGQQTNSPVPGDLCIYQGHISVYVGNGQAVHGGWLGNQTVLSTVECTNAFVAYIHVNHS